METPNRNVSVMVLLMALIVGVTAVGGLGVVHLRRQIDNSARRAQVAEQERALLREKILLLDTQIARLHTPEELTTRLVAAGLPLAKPGERQIVRLGGSSGELLAEAARREAGEAASGATIEPFRTTYGLALLGRD